MALITLDTNGTLAKDGVEDIHAFLCSIMAAEDQACGADGRYFTLPSF